MTAMLSAFRMVERRCATTIAVRPMEAMSSASCTMRSDSVSSARPVHAGRGGRRGRGPHLHQGTQDAAVRRVCPGLAPGMLHVEYFVANLVREFQWREAHSEAVDLAEFRGFFFTVNEPARSARASCPYLPQHDHECHFLLLISVLLLKRMLLARHCCFGGVPGRGSV
ncbi:hypothetical protein PR202_gb08760 [Eleusine coracana subsp. coracana]|uniref:Uncharacterized protein n=1 Tax=Eleusine coracana subsp. coracana TaxID=191504 RepID=A0AAV5EGD9_ELECO|nr:hypothetical protein PR202_gb08760 [Eleusine coracana subsp. coracana]